MSRQAVYPLVTEPDAAGFDIVETSDGTFAFEDGTGRSVAIRFTTPAAERRVLIDPDSGNEAQNSIFTIQERFKALFVG